MPISVAPKAEGPVALSLIPMAAKRYLNSSIKAIHSTLLLGCEATSGMEVLCLRSARAKATRSEIRRFPANKALCRSLEELRPCIHPLPHLANTHGIEQNTSYTSLGLGERDLQCLVGSDWVSTNLTLRGINILL